MFLIAGVVVTSLHAQQVIDGPFITERFVLNAPIALLEDQVPNWKFLMDNIAPVRDYALDEPWTWTQRIYQRIEPAQNPTLGTITGLDGAHTLADVVNAALDRGDITQYADLGFCLPRIVSEVEHVVPSPVILKVDFAYNDSTHLLEPHIIGFAMLRSGGSVGVFYYPEFRAILEPLQVQGPLGQERLSEHFESWHFIAHAVPPADVEELLGHPYFNVRVFEEQSEFDALTSLFLLEHEIENRQVLRSGMRSVKVSSYAPTLRNISVEFTPKGALQRVVIKRAKGSLLVANYKEGVLHGPFREFFGDGGLKQQGQFEQGLRVGEWVCWYANSNIRSRRMYVAGRLDGTQRAYYDNGTLHMEYGIEDGDYEGDHKAYYSDGHLKSSGTMHAGFVTGEWSYSIRISNALKAYMDKDPSRFPFPATAWQDDHLDYRVTYTQTGTDSWDCPLRTCIDVVWTKVVE